jgi:hypothetical protein
MWSIAQISPRAAMFFFLVKKVDKSVEEKIHKNKNKKRDNFDSFFLSYQQRT